MSISLEQIEMLKERAHVSYQEAKEILERCNGDVVEALIELEKQSKVTAKAPIGESGACGFGSTTKKIFKATEGLLKKGNEIKFVIKKAENTVVDIPLNAAILVTIIAPPVTIVGVLGALVTGHKIKFVRPDGGDMCINKHIDKISTAVNSVSNQVVEAVKKQ